MFYRLSDTARAVLWLWYNDPKNWVVGTHAVVHGPTGLGIWLANEVYGLHLKYDIPDRDRSTGHPCNGKEVRLKWLDRWTIYKAVVGGLGSFAHAEIQRQISDWATDKIRNSVGDPAYQRS